MVFRTFSFVITIILIIFEQISWVYRGVSVYIFLAVKKYCNRTWGPVREPFLYSDITFILSFFCPKGNLDIVFIAHYFEAK